MKMAISQEEGLRVGYHEMANNREREAEAQEWCERLIGDVADQKG